jgi:hypothetical protein
MGPGILYWAGRGQSHPAKQERDHNDGERRVSWAVKFRLRFLEAKKAGWKLINTFMNIPSYKNNCYPQ